MRRSILSLLILMTMSGCCASKLSGLRTCDPGGLGGPGGPGDTIPGAEGSGVLQDVHFDFDSSALSEESKDKLRRNAQWLNENSSRNIIVEGHCDERGTNEYNMALGERRAHSAYDFLRGLGVQANRMGTISYGEELPVDPGHNEAAWAKNRRAHFTLK